MALDLTEDLLLADGLESVTFVPRDAEEEAVIDALRRPLKKKEVAESYGGYLSLMASWHVPVAQLSRDFEVGDALRDADGKTWTALEAELHGLTGKWRVLGIELSLALTTTLKLQQRTEELDELGARTPAWADVVTPGPELSARVQPVATAGEVDEGNRRTLTPRFEVTVVAPGDGFRFQADHSFLDEATGLRYLFDSYAHPESLSMLQTLNCHIDEGGGLE